MFVLRNNLLVRPKPLSGLNYHALCWSCYLQDAYARSMLAFLYRMSEQEGPALTHPHPFFCSLFPCCSVMNKARHIILLFGIPPLRNITVILLISILRNNPSFFNFSPETQWAGGFQPQESPSAVPACQFKIDKELEKSESAGNEKTNQANTRPSFKAEHNNPRCPQSGPVQILHDRVKEAF